MADEVSQSFQLIRHDGLRGFLRTVDIRGVNGELFQLPAVDAGLDDESLRLPVMHAGLNGGSVLLTFVNVGLDGEWGHR